MPADSPAPEIPADAPLVSNISDTARWVAAYRARESERPDALFRDPFAERLAGEHGKQLAARLGTRDLPWVIAVRTRIIDDLIAAAIADGADRVLNLAAGLDTRPYRLDLPPDLIWIEADLPAMVEEKTRALADQTPACDLRRETLDLADARARAEVLRRSLDGSHRSLVITEGLLVYLEASTVRDLGHDLHANGAGWWIADLCSTRALGALQRHTDPVLGDARMRFAPEEGVKFFEPLGFAARDVRSFLAEGARLRRLPSMLRPFAKQTTSGSKHPWSAVVRFERA